MPSDKPDIIDEYLDSLTRDLYLIEDFLPWDEVEERTAALAPGINALQSLVDEDSLEPEALASALFDVPVFEVVKTLLAAPSGVGFADRRAIADSPPDNLMDARKLAKLLLDLHLREMIVPGTDVGALLRVAIVGRDARSRGYRRRRSLEKRADGLLARAIQEASRITDEELLLIRPSLFPATKNMYLPNIRSLVIWQNRPVAAIATIFEAQSGGRQVRNINALVDTQRELNGIPAALIAVADGQGVRDSRFALRRVWGNVAAIMSLQQAEYGSLTDTVVSAVRARGLLTREASQSLDQLVAARLRDTSSLRATDLPISVDAAAIELARYASEREDLALELSGAGSDVILRWRRPEIVLAAGKLRVEYQPEIALSVLESILGVKSDNHTPVEPFSGALISGFSQAALPSEFAVLAIDATADADIVRAAAKSARTLAATATLGILIVPEAGLWPESNAQTELNRTAVTNMVVLDSEVLQGLAAMRDPYAALASHVLRQVDLTKNSPFVYNGAAPSRVYAGRRSEQATIIAALTTNSVALLGSRRIGKTSLMHRTAEALIEQGRTVYRADCEAIGDWDGLARHANRRWNVNLAPGPFRPDAVSELVSQLTIGGPPVLLLDEVDRLVAWDYETATAGVNEALFHQFRALSQDNRVQFVLSGERTIAERMWSSASPHFNFCQAVDLRQLDMVASQQLLFGVLESLGIIVSNRDEAVDLAWRATSGHPRLVQLIGDRLVRIVNGRQPADRNAIGLADLQAVIQSVDYKREYVETYWGQATSFEQAIAEAVIAGETNVSTIAPRIDMAPGDLAFRHALRMLELYGIIDLEQNDVALRAEYFASALELSYTQDA